MTKTSWLHEYWQSLIYTEVAVQGKISTSISKMNSNIFNKTHYNIAKLSTVCADGHTIIWVINSMTEQRVFVETVASLLQTLSANPNKYPQHGSEHHGIYLWSEILWSKEYSKHLHVYCSICICKIMLDKSKVSSAFFLFYAFNVQYIMHP